MMLAHQAGLVAVHVDSVYYVTHPGDVPLLHLDKE
jgi:hypothetical protein